MTKKLSDERNDGFLTDPYRFDGYALYERAVRIAPDRSDSEIFFVMVRTRTSHLWIDGKYAGSQNSLCAPHRYNITEYCEKLRFGNINLYPDIAAGNVTVRGDIVWCYRCTEVAEFLLGQSAT